MNKHIYIHKGVILVCLSGIQVHNFNWSQANLTSTLNIALSVKEVFCRATVDTHALTQVGSEFGAEAEGSHSVAAAAMHWTLPWMCRVHRTLATNLPGRCWLPLIHAGTVHLLAANNGWAGWVMRAMLSSKLANCSKYHTHITSCIKPHAVATNKATVAAILPPMYLCKCPSMYRGDGLGQAVGGSFERWWRYANIHLNHSWTISNKLGTNTESQTAESLSLCNRTRF